VSGAGWGNPVVGGVALRIPAIQSPNFSLANQTGWAIFADGSAFFFNVTVSGTITGGTLVVDGPAGGVFVYSGAPAAGNLIGSWAGAAGTDAFGNTYPAGFSSSAGAISGSVFTGADFIINSAGIFIYSGTPAGPGGGTLTETAVTPQVITATGGVASTTNTFSPPSGSMVVVPVAWLFASNIGATVTCKDSLGTVYTAGPQVQDVNDVGISAVFSHVYAVAPGAVTVTVTCSNAGGARAVLAPRVLTGQAASQAGAATVAATGGPSLAVQKSITTTKPGSLVYLAAETSAVATLTAITGTATILADADALVGDTGGTGRTGATVTPGATTIGWTSSLSESFGFAALEVLPGLSGTGNLIGSWAGQPGTDAFGNAYPQGLNVSVGAITGSTISGSTISGSTFTGTDFILNSSGLFLYSGAPAAGNLIISLTQAAGTDGFGNTFAKGATFYASSTAYTALTGSSSGNLSLTPAGSGNGGGLELPSLAGTPASTNSILYADAGGSLGFRNGAAGYNGQLVNSKTDTTPRSTLSTAGAPQQVSSLLNLPALDAQAGTIYRIILYGGGAQGSVQGATSVQLALNSVSAASSGWVAATVPISTGWTWRAEGSITILTTGVSGTATFHISGMVGLSGRTPIANQQVYGAYSTTAVTINTTAANTLSILGQVAGTGGTLTGLSSTFERLGP